MVTRERSTMFAQNRYILDAQLNGNRHQPASQPDKQNGLQRTNCLPPAREKTKLKSKPKSFPVYYSQPQFSFKQLDLLSTVVPIRCHTRRLSVLLEELPELSCPCSWPASSSPPPPPNTSSWETPEDVGEFNFRRGPLCLWLSAIPFRNFILLLPGLSCSCLQRRHPRGRPDAMQWARDAEMSSARLFFC